MAAQSHIEKCLNANNARVLYGGFKKVLVTGEEQISTCIEGGTENWTILWIADFCLSLNCLFRSGNDVKSGQRCVEKCFKLNSAVRELFSELPMQLIDYIIADYRLIRSYQCLVQSFCSTSFRKECSRDEDVGVDHYPHSALSSRRDCVIHSATASSLSRPTFSASPLICS